MTDVLYRNIQTRYQAKLAWKLAAKFLSQYKLHSQ